MIYQRQLQKLGQVLLGVMQFRRHKSQLACVYLLFAMGKKQTIPASGLNLYGSGEVFKGNGLTFGSVEVTPKL